LLQAILGGEESHNHGENSDCMDSLEQRAIWRGLAQKKEAKVGEQTKWIFLNYKILNTKFYFYIYFKMTSSSQVVISVVVSGLLIFHVCF
jgi:hypothetical protein